MKKETVPIILFAVVFLAASHLCGQSLRSMKSRTSPAGHLILSQATNDTSKAPPDFVNVDIMPRIVSQVVPRYPETAKKKGIEGRVIVKLWIDKKGDVRKAFILKSTNKIFDQPSIDAAMKYKFSPVTYRDKPVSVWVIVPFNYRLKPESAETVSDTTLAGKYKKEMIDVLRRANSYEEMVKQYDAAMYFQRMRRYKEALKSYRDFLKRSKDFPNAPEEMVRHAKLMVEKYSKVRGNAK